MTIVFQHYTVQFSKPFIIIYKIQNTQQYIRPHVVKYCRRIIFGMVVDQLVDFDRLILVKPNKELSVQHTSYSTHLSPLLPNPTSKCVVKFARKLRSLFSVLSLGAPRLQKSGSRARTSRRKIMSRDVKRRVDFSLCGKQHEHSFILFNVRT